VNSNLAPENTQPAAARGLPLFVPELILLVAALAYYGSYWHYWFNPHDEGGTACLVAQRLLHGERPWVDLEPGYNIGWFYPIVGLFHFTGVNYLAARAWFFALSTVTALLGCGIVTRVSGSRCLGLATGLLLVIFPGSQFKNYIPLAEAANTACLIHLLYADPAVRRKWLGFITLSGVVLGLTFLVRVELGYFFTAIWVLLLVVALADRRAPIASRLTGSIFGLVALAFGVALAQAPVYADLRARGLETSYWAEYTGWLEFLRASLDERLHQAKEPAAPAATVAASQPELPPAAQSAGTTATTVRNAENGDRSVLPRKPLSAILKRGAPRRPGRACLSKPRSHSSPWQPPLPNSSSSRFQHRIAPQPAARQSGEGTSGVTA